jgi:prophage regulatory protein
MQQTPRINDLQRDVRALQKQLEERKDDPPKHSIQLWRLPRVMSETGLSKTSIYKLIKQGKFPAQIKLGIKASAWDASAVQTWIKNLIQGAAA